MRTTVQTDPAFDLPHTLCLHVDSSSAIACVGSDPNVGNEFANHHTDIRDFAHPDVGLLAMVTDHVRGEVRSESGPERNRGTLTC